MLEAVRRGRTWPELIDVSQTLVIVEEIKESWEKGMRLLETATVSFSLI